MIEIGSRRELFVDDYLVDFDKTTAKMTLNKPVKREAAFIHNEPWEKDICVYHNITRMPDGKYAMYYKSHHYGRLTGSDQYRTLRKICVLFSDDGLHWSRPELDIQPIEGSPVNNIINDEGWLFDNLFVFYDTNPKCPENERYKGIYGEWSTGLFAYKSADGLHFDWHGGVEIMNGKETGCYFDSLNTVYFNNDIGKYVAFVRGFHVGEDNYPPDPDVPDAKRDIRISYSEDFVHWTYPERLEYNDSYDYQLYTNAVSRYYRAPHLWLATPTRYNARGEWSDNFEKLPNPEERRHRGRGTSVTDCIFMSSRDCEKWYRFSEGFITPGPEQFRNWLYGDCYPCIGVVETPNEIEGADPYLSLYCKEDHEGEPIKLYRYSLRMDGFTCIKSTYEPQMLVTKPFTFEGSELEINFATSGAGYMKFTLEAEEGTAIHSGEIFGDKIDRKVGFEDGTVSSLSGKSVVMKVEMSDAEFYSFKFNK